MPSGSAKPVAQRGERRLERLLAALGSLGSHNQERGLGPEGGEADHPLSEVLYRRVTRALAVVRSVWFRWGKKSREMRWSIRPSCFLNI